MNISCKSGFVLCEGQRTGAKVGGAWSPDGRIQKVVWVHPGLCQHLRAQNMAGGNVTNCQLQRRTRMQQLSENEGDAYAFVVLLQEESFFCASVCNPGTWGSISNLLSHTADSCHSPGHTVLRLCRLQTWTPPIPPLPPTVWNVPTCQTSFVFCPLLPRHHEVVELGLRE